MNMQENAEATAKVTEPRTEDFEAEGWCMECDNAQHECNCENYTMESDARRALKAKGFAAETELMVRKAERTEPNTATPDDDLIVGFWDVYCECDNPVYWVKPADVWVCDKCGLPQE